MALLNCLEHLKQQNPCVFLIDSRPIQQELLETLATNQFLLIILRQHPHLNDIVVVIILIDSDKLAHVINTLHLVQRLEFPLCVR